jgi:stage II sporulation protein D
MYSLSLRCLLLLLVTIPLYSCARPEPLPETANIEQVGIAVDFAGIDAAAREAIGEHDGCILAIEPQTGRLLAVVNPRLAYEQAFPPGSTIKPFTALTATRSGIIDPEWSVACRQRYRHGDFEIVCSHAPNREPIHLEEALAQSCNYFFATVSERVSPALFRSTLASFGFGSKTGINAGSESAGTLSTEVWRVEDGLGEGSHLLATPIQLLTAYSALFNGGRLFTPQVGRISDLPDRPRLKIDSRQREALVRGCRAAVEHGTSSPAGLGSLPVFVFGKTGTSTASNGFTRNGWFVAFAADPLAAPAPTPDSLRLGVLVFLKRAKGIDAAMVARDFLQRCTAKADNVHAVNQAAAPAQPVLRVRLSREGRTESVPLEDYVARVLSLESASEDELEALKAQAIVSRTYALRNLGRHGNEGYDLCSLTHCQQYSESEATEIQHRAVVETSGQVLVDDSGRLADVYFHAACGGMTANIESLWGVPAPSYLRGVRDDYCVTLPDQHWTDQIPRERLAAALAADPHTETGRRLASVRVVKRDNTGRAEVVEVEGERRRLVRGWEFKVIVGRSLGWKLIKSSRFDVVTRGPAFVFRGSGFGHGLGLCQQGAHVMARRGADRSVVLNHFFPGTRISGLFENASAAVSEIREPSLSAGQTWLSQSSNHFLARYTSAVQRRFVDDALLVLESARTDVIRRLSAASLTLQEGKRIEIVIQPTTQEFIAATGQPWWSAAATSGGRIQLQPLDTLRRRRIVTTTLRHEYAHAVTESLSGGRGPRWLAEGVAIHFAGEGRLFNNVRPMTITTDELERRLSHPSSSQDQRALYGLAFQKVRALIDAQGEPAVWKLLAAGMP